MSELLLELFSEEIPALMQKNAVESYKTIFTTILQENRLLRKLAYAQGFVGDTERKTAAYIDVREDLSTGSTHKLPAEVEFPKRSNELGADVQVYVGSRRIAVHITNLPKFIPPKEVTIRGPKVSAPPQAIEGFCRANNIEQKKLSTLLVQGQLYYIIVKSTTETDIRVLLQEIIPKAISKYIWSKSMYWGNYDISWIRPLRNILCIFDGEILAIKYGHLMANNITFGHRFISPEPITIYSFSEYQNKLRESNVIIDQQERKEIIKSQLSKIVKSLNLVIKEDEKLLEEVTGLVELPVVMVGKIPEIFLQLPSEVLVSSMRTHQKYFSVFDQAGNFAPYFLFVSNRSDEQNIRLPAKVAYAEGFEGDSERKTAAYSNVREDLSTESTYKSPAEVGFCRKSIIVSGNEKVLAARLSDALYFYQQDLSNSLESKLPKLAQITFHAKIGSIKQKTERIANICNYIMLGDQDLQLAARLCKSDLTTEMVGEFPELQGIMGYYYAKAEGLNDQIALAIRDHYKPQGPSDSLPMENSAILAIADKLDSLVGLILIGEEPSGSRDPYSLRRQALGIIRIILANKLTINIKQLVAYVVQLYSEENISCNKSSQIILEFLEERTKYYFKNHYDLSLINAVLDFNIEEDLVVSEIKLSALQKFLAGVDGENLLTIYKRANNILEGSNIAGEVNQNAFISPYEQQLFLSLESILPQIDNSIAEKDFTKALSLLLEMLKPINDFFDNLMVKDEDHRIANNRLLLLKMVTQLFDKLAKFSAL